MAQHTEDDTSAVWLGRLSEARRGVEAQGRVRKWRQYRDWYHNKYPSGVIAVNLLFAIGRSLIPQLYYKVPTILVVPRKPNLDIQSKILESVDQWLVTHMGMKAQIKLGLLDAFLTNLAVFKFGYHSIGTELPPPPPPARPEGLAGIMDAVREIVGAKSPAEAKAEDADAEEEARRQYSYHDWIKPDSPWMLRVQPEDFLVPTGTRDIYSMPWCAFRVVRPVEDMRADPVYRGAQNLQPNAAAPVDAEGVMSPTTKSAGAQTNLVEFFEIWDKRDRTIRVVADGHSDFLRHEQHTLPIDGLPVEILQFNPTGWDFWGESDAHQINQQIVEYNETRTLEMMHKRAAVTKILVDKNLMEDAEIAKMNRGEIGVAKTDGPPSVVAHALNMTMSRDIFAISDVIRDDVREILGFGRNQGGDFDVSRRTATEASIVQQAIQLRSDERRDQVADFIAAAFQRKIHPMIFDLWTEEHTIEVTGKGGWTKFTGPQIKGDYDVTAIPDSVLPLTRAQRQQSAQQMFASFKGDPRVDQRRLYEWVLSQYEGIVPDDLLLSEDEHTQQLQAAQTQVLQAQQAKAAMQGDGRAGA